MKATLEILHSQWAWSDPSPPLILKGGVYTLEEALAGRDDLDVAAFLRIAAAAEAATGGVRISDTDAAADKIIGRAVQPDTAAVKELEKAQADGRWRVGHLQQVIVGQEQFLETGPAELTRACAAASACDGEERVKWEAYIVDLNDRLRVAPGVIERARAELEQLEGVT